MQLQFRPFIPPAMMPAVLPMRSMITRQGLLTINYAAWRALGEAEWVHLLFDPVNAVIGVKPVFSTTPNARPLKRRKDAKIGFLLPVRDFCNYYGLDWRGGIKFQRIDTHDDGTLILYLDPSTRYFRRMA